MTGQLAPVMVEGDPKALTLLDVNARYMTYEQFHRLCENVRRDGALTSAPLVWNDQESGRLIVLSGNHRVKAALEVGLTRIGWMQIDQPLDRQRQVALQLSHNAITGQDDPAVLKNLFNELEELSEREYAGLDDKTLDLLTKVDVGSLNDANLDYATVQIVFLPHEKDAAREALDEANKLMKVDERWLAHKSQHDEVLDALDTARSVGQVGNTATALSIILAVFDSHLEDLQQHWVDPYSGEPTRKSGTVPIETVTGTRHLPPGDAATLLRATRKMAEREEIHPDKPWQALALLAAAYLQRPS
jgi:hypothetical protein